MAMKKDNLSKSELRQQAEEKLRKLKKKAVPTEADALRLVHELEVHQIELEMQSEELELSRDAAEAAFQHYADLYDFAPVGYFTLGRDGTIHKVNFSGANLLKTKLGKLVKRRFGLFVSQQSLSIFNAFLEKVFVSGEKQTCEIELLLDGESLWVQIEAVLETGQREMCRAVLVDISARKRAEAVILKSHDELERLVQERTAQLLDANKTLQAELSARKQAEETLEENKENLSILFETMSEGVALNEIIYDENGEMVDYRILSVNRAFYSTADYHGSTVVGNVATQLYGMSSEFIKEFWKQHKEKNSIAYTEMDSPIDKRCFFVATSPFVNDKFVTSFFDITARKQAEEEIRQLNASLEERIQERTVELREAQEQLVRHEKLAALGKMAGSMGHELRNPLGVISNAVYFLRISQPDADVKVKEYLNIIEQHMQISNKIVSDMLDLARSKSAKRESVSVSELIHHTLDYFPAPPSVRVILDLPADLPKIYADPQHVTQILSNLILNAYQSMISTDSARETKAGNLSISSRVQDDMIRISIQDSGVGIPPENMKKLFEPLFTTKIKGIGLGLAISWELAEANGGKIEVQSEVGVGSVFTLCLPIEK